MKKIYLKINLAIATLVNSNVAYYFIASGSFEFLIGTWGDQGKTTTKKLSNGDYEQTTTFSSGADIKRIGKRNSYTQWNGVNTTSYYSATSDNSEVPVKIEEGIYVDGYRNGEFTITYSDKPTEYICYKMGKVVPCKKSARITTEDVSAFQALNKYPWYLDLLNLFGFDAEHIMAYTDTLETIIATYEYDIAELNNYYFDALDSLENTVFDSIISVNWGLTFYLGNERLKKSEFRMAVIDRTRSETKNTYNTVKKTYPGYLLSLNEVGITDQDFEGFCHEFDSLMESYQVLDLEDPFFTDSVDSQMGRAISYIGSTEKSALLTMQKLKSAHNKTKTTLRQLVLDTNPTDVASYIGTLMLSDYILGDLIRISVEESYYNKNGVARFPTVITEYSNGSSATSAIINGYVIEDGGANITSRGIAWASNYNPTINDNLEASGIGAGEYSATLTGLTDGETYYSRAYATNSAGTAYGNNITFIARSTVGVNDSGIDEFDFIIYPNPASNNVMIKTKSSQPVALQILNIEGKQIKQINEFTTGEINLSDFVKGIYIIQITDDKHISTKRLIVK